METPTQTVAPPPPEQKPAERSTNYGKFLQIIKNRLGKIANETPSTSTQEGEKGKDAQAKKNTAQALLNIINGQENPIESFTTAIKPLESQPSAQPSEPPADETSEEATTKPTEASAEEPQKVTYNNVKIVDKTIIATDPNGNEVRFSLSELAADMARTIGLPDHQIELIKNHLAGEPIVLGEVAGKFGFLTSQEISSLFGIPPDQQQRQAMLDDKNTPQWQKRLIEKVGRLPEIPEAPDIIDLFKAAEIPTDKPLAEAIKSLKKHAEKLPEEQKQAFTQLIESIEQQSTNQTVAEAITEQYEKLTAGEDIDIKETAGLITSLFQAENISKQLSETDRKKIIDKAVKFGKTGGIIVALLTILMIWRGSKELTGNPQQ